MTDGMIEREREEEERDADSRVDYKRDDGTRVLSTRCARFLRARARARFWFSRLVSVVGASRGQLIGVYVKPARLTAARRFISPINNQSERGPRVSGTLVFSFPNDIGRLPSSCYCSLAKDGVVIRALSRFFLSLFDMSYDSECNVYLSKYVILDICSFMSIEYRSVYYSISC